MPDPNQTDPNKNQVPTQGGTPSDVTTPQVPDFQSTDSSATVPTEPINSPQVESPITTTIDDVKRPEDGGSSAPSDLPPMTSSPKKKFGGGKIIATILGFLTLVGGIAGGVILTQQQQDIREKAASNNCNVCLNNVDDPKECDSVCNPQPGGGGGGGNEICNPGATQVVNCNFINGSGTCPGKLTQTCTSNGKSWANSGTCQDVVADNCPALPSNVSCSTNGGVCVPSEQECVDGKGVKISGTCGGVNQTCCGNLPTGTSIPSGTTGSCTNPPTGISCDDNGCTVGSFSNSSSVNELECIVNHYWCQGVKAPGVGCQDALIGRGTSQEFSKSCGTEQIDIVCKPQGISGAGCYTDATHMMTWVSKRYSSNCSGGGTGTPPAASASCQNIKAYSETWSLLSAAQLSQLKAADKVNFCVAGVTTQGTFDKAKFTINSVAQAETTTKRPTSNDFCQLYTIPAGLTTFSITAQIHHATLDWK